LNAEAGMPIAEVLNREYKVSPITSGEDLEGLRECRLRNDFLLKLSYHEPSTMNHELKNKLTHYYE